MAKHIHVHLPARERAKYHDSKANDSFPTKFSIRGRNYISAGKLRNNGQQACYEELDPKGGRTGRMIWLTTTGQVVADAVKDAEQAIAEKVQPGYWQVINQAGKIVGSYRGAGAEREAKAHAEKLNSSVVKDAQKPYISLMHNKWEVLTGSGKVAKTFEKNEREAAQKYLRDNFDKLTKDTRDSEENDAYIQGYKDALKGKQPDAAFHPGGEKKPAVTAKYAAGHKQGTEDRKKKGGKDEGGGNLGGSSGTATVGVRG